MELTAERIEELERGPIEAMGEALAAHIGAIDDGEDPLLTVEALRQACALGERYLARFHGKIAEGRMTYRNGVAVLGAGDPDLLALDATLCAWEADLASREDQLEEMQESYAALKHALES